MEKRKHLLDQVKTSVHALAPDAESILYGSRAKGTLQADSDWDFLISLPSLVNKSLERQIKDQLYDVELETDTVINSIVRTKQEWELLRYDGDR